MASLQQTSPDLPGQGVGVVIVHGMGHPQPAALLDSIVRSLADHLSALGPPSGPAESPAWHSLTGADGRVYRILRYAGRQWTFTEAHWAPHVAPPPFQDTVYWAWRHFLAHAALLARQTFIGALWPALRTAAEVAWSSTVALALLPILVLLSPVAVPLTFVTQRWMAQGYYRQIAEVPDDADIDHLQSAMGRWRATSPGLAGSSYGMAAALLAGLCVLPWWGWPLAIAVGVYVGLGVRQVTRSLAQRLTFDPVLAGAPVSVLLATGITLSKAGFLQAHFQTPLRGRLIRTALASLYRDLAHSPARRAVPWLMAQGEIDLVNQIRWTIDKDRLGSGARVSAAVAALLVFRSMAALTALFLYLAGALLIFPLTAALLALSQLPGQRSAHALTTRIKRKVQGAVLTSIGDINLFTRHPEQAERARAEVERALDALQPMCADLFIVAHSLGCAVSYDTLAQPGNAHRAERVRALVTVGGILPMVWRTSPRRPSFDAPLPPGIRWLNLWARFDPAEGGPISPERLKAAMPDLATPTQHVRPWSLLWLLPRPAPASRSFEDVAVSNADSILLDHTSYWTNLDEVMPRIARELWPGGGAELDARERSDAARAYRRRLHILRTTGLRLVTLYLAGGALWAGWGTAGAASVATIGLAASWMLSRRAARRLANATAQPPVKTQLAHDAVVLPNDRRGTVVAFGSSRLSARPLVGEHTGDHEEDS